MQTFFLLLLASQIFTFSYSQSVDSQAASSQIDSRAAPLSTLSGLSQSEPQAAEVEAAAKGRGKGKKGRKAKAAKGRKRRGKGKNGKGLNAAGRIRFDPPLLKLQQYSTSEVPVEVSLSEPPKGRVSVYIEAPNMIFSECVLEFTPENWNQKRKISVTPTPYMTASAKTRQIKAKFCLNAAYDAPIADPAPGPGPTPAPAPAPVPDPDQNNNCEEFPIQRRKGKGCRCSARGDPHYTSFGRRKFDFMGKGAYYLVKSDKLSVQEFNSKIRTASAETKVAVRYYNTVIIFDGNNKKAHLASATSEGVQLTKVPGVHWKATLSDGSVIKIPFGKRPKNKFLGTVVMLGQEYKGKVAGLCGKVGKAGKGAKGQAFEAAAAKGWKVPPEDNMFKLGSKAASVVASIKPASTVKKNYCKVPDLKSSSNARNGISYEQGEVQMTDLEGFQAMRDEDIADESGPSAAKAPTKAWLNAVKAKCTAIMTIKQVNALLSPRKFINDCVEDCILTQSYDLIEDTKRAYLSAAQDYLRSAKAEPVYNKKSPAAQKLMAAVNQACDAAGLGYTKCPNDCSNKGLCTSIGCACDVGYTGIDCGREIPQAPPVETAYTNEPAPPPSEEEEDDPEPQISVAVNSAVEETPEERDDGNGGEDDDMETAGIDHDGEGEEDKGNEEDETKQEE